MSDHADVASPHKSDLDQSSEKFAIYDDKSRVFCMVMLGATFAVGGAIMFFFRDVMGQTSSFFSSGTVALVGVTVAVFCGLGTIFWIKKLLSRVPVISADHQYLTDNSMIGRAIVIPWNEVVEIDTRMSAFKRDKMERVAIDLRQPEKYLDNGSWLGRRGLQENYKYFGTPIAIRIFTTGMPRERLLSALRGCWQASASDQQVTRERGERGE